MLLGRSMRAQASAFFTCCLRRRPWLPTLRGVLRVLAGVVGAISCAIGRLAHTGSVSWRPCPIALACGDTGDLPLRWALVSEFALLYYAGPRPQACHFCNGQGFLWLACPYYVGPPHTGPGQMQGEWHPMAMRPAHGSTRSSP